MASAKTIEVAKVVNSLLHLSSSDQESLLAVVEDYFTSPDEHVDDFDVDSFDDSDTELGTDEPGKFIHTVFISACMGMKIETSIVHVSVEKFTNYNAWMCI